MSGGSWRRQANIERLLRYFSGLRRSLIGGLIAGERLQFSDTRFESLDAIFLVGNLLFHISEF